MRKFMQWRVVMPLLPLAAMLLALPAPDSLHSAAVLSVGPGDGDGDGDDQEKCSCVATFTEVGPSQLDGCGNAPLITPTNQGAKNGVCITPEEGACQTQPGSQCSGSVEVKVTFPPSGSTCPTLWLKGGATYPVPTQINVTSDVIVLDAKADCRAGGGPSASKKKVSVWKTKPLLHNGRYPEPDASYTFKVSCSACAHNRKADTDG